MVHAELTQGQIVVVLEDFKDGFIVQVTRPLAGEVLSTNFYTVFENALIQFALKVNNQVMVMANCQSFDEEEAFIKKLKEA